MKNYTLCLLILMVVNGTIGSLLVSYLQVNNISLMIPVTSYFVYCLVSGGLLGIFWQGNK